MNKIEFPHTTVCFENNMVCLIFKEGALLDVKEVRELIAVAEKLAGYKKYLLFSDARVNVNITPEARSVSADKKEAPLLVANAVLINSLALRITANFFNNVNKPHFKFQVFTNEKKAKSWLLTFKP